MFLYWSTSLVKKLLLAKWAVLSLRIIWGIFIWSWIFLVKNNSQGAENTKLPLLRNVFLLLLLFFLSGFFFHEHSRIAGLQGKGEDISLTPHYHFHPLHRHWDISRTISAEKCQVFYLSFNKAMTLNCSSLSITAGKVYFYRKYWNVLRDRPVL